MKGNRQTLAEQAYARLEEMIVTLALAPGSSFSEAELCARLQIGRTPVREALQRLAAEHLVATMPRRGMMVTEINIADHLALLETRRVLDGLIASRAARRASEAQRRQLRRHAEEITRAASAGDLAEFMRLDRESDLVMEAACRNSYAVRACAPLRTHCRRFWYCYQENGDLAESANRHTAVIAAVVSGDEDEARTRSEALIDYLVAFARAAIDEFTL